MARIDIKSNGATLNDGVLQLENGVALDTTLRSVTDQNNTTSPLKLSTTAVQVNSPLRITTSDASGFYLDAEDSATNNRFSIKRDPSSQEVTLDFASNPAGSTSLVGAIRTYQDGVNLSNAMSFIEDGSVGIGTNAPVGILHLKTSAKNTRLAIDGDAGFNKLISYRTAGLQRFGLYTNNTAESGSNAGSDFAIRAYNDAGTLLNTPVFIKRSTGNVGINTLTGTAKLQVVGSGSTSATTSLLVQNSGGTASLNVKDDLSSTFGGVGRFTRSANNYIDIDASNNGTSPAINFLYSGVVNRGISFATSTADLSIANGFFLSDSAGTAVGLIANDFSGNTIESRSGICNLAGTGDSYLRIYQRGVLSRATIGTKSGTNYLQIRSGGASSLTDGTLSTIFDNVGSVGIGGITTVNSSSLLEMSSTTKGFLPPRMTNVERAAITTPAVGLMVYCTDVVEGLYVYKSTGWTFVI